MATVTLGDKQRAFVRMLADLIMFAYESGYELTQGDGFRDPRTNGKIGEKKGYGHPNSNHKRRLAQDYNLFIDRVWITSGENPAWRVLHDYWESIGGAPMIEGDPNHFSVEWNGQR
ncbi:hypothetical protein [Vibrio phage CKB-S2]|nr:hypothetical protein [Vibrio phage CKB-S2]